MATEVLELLCTQICLLDFSFKWRSALSKVENPIEIENALLDLGILLIMLWMWGLAAN